MVLAGILEEWVNRRRERRMAEAIAQGKAKGLAKGRAKGRAKGIAKGSAETHALWRAWNDRRLDALAKGEPFDEPPPDIAGISENGR